MVQMMSIRELRHVESHFKCIPIDSNGGNPMRAPDGSIDLLTVLAGHIDPTLAQTHIEEVHELFAQGKTMTKEERTKRGWDEAYDLRPWNEFPGTENATLTTVVLQNLTGGWLGNGGGPTKESMDIGAHLRELIASLVVS